MLAGELKKTIEELDSIIGGNSFIQDWVTMDARDAKKAHPDFAEHLKTVPGRASCRSRWTSWRRRARG
eukprot:14845035-Alexandrium_andersonii.AAC.1